MSFIRFWMGFTVVGLAATVALLYWAVRSRQFGEPDRAAYLPLEGTRGEAPRTRASREAVALVGLLGVGLLAFVATVVASLAW